MNLLTTRLLAAMLAIQLVDTAFCESPQIAPDAKSVRPLRVGDTLPDVAVKTAIGQSVKLSSFRENGPLVVVVFRGGWCPVCTRHFADIIKIHPEIISMGATMIAISPDSEASTRDNISKLKPPFPLLSDADLAAAKSMGLAFQVDQETIAKYKGFGIDLEKASGRNHHALPVPAVYIVSQSGKILFAHSNPDYTQRLDTGEIVAELKKSK